MAEEQGSTSGRSRRPGSSKTRSVISDEHFARWRAFFSEEELIELGAFLAICDGFGKLVEVLGLGQQEQVCAYELRQAG